jgi:hypothetical protein
MHIFRRAIALAGACVGTAAIAGTGCADATQVTLDLSTDFDCQTSQGVAIFMGLPGETELATEPAARLVPCNGRELGTLVATPRSDHASQLSIRVVVGVDVPVEECIKSAYYHGCIVARRRVTFAPHRDLRVPIVLRTLCKNVNCVDTTTCGKRGRCEDALVDVPSCDSDIGCVPPSEGPLI